MNPYENYDKEFFQISEKKVEPVRITTPIQKPMQPKTSILKVVAYLLLFVFLTGAASTLYVYSAVNTKSVPNTLPITIDIPKGSSLQSVTNRLDEAGIISSAFVFRSSMIFARLESSIKTGEYTFSRPLRMTEIIERLVRGQYEYIPERLIIREGEGAQSVVDAITTQFPKLSTTTVTEEVLRREGKLFPETYLFAPFASLNEILTTIDAEYQKRITAFKPAIASSTRSEEEILTVASILEREVPLTQDMKMVSGIIYNRLKIGMPLQMDSTVGYVTGKASLDLTFDDLKIDSPYNTYAYKGLPPGPIGNPGEVSIDAALHPETHSYIFFLSDAAGVNHYAKTYAEHLANRKKYLDK